MMGNKVYLSGSDNRQAVWNTLQISAAALPYGGKITSHAVEFDRAYLFYILLSLSW